MAAGKLDHRVAFDSPTLADNGGGGQVMGWAEQISICWAGFRYLRGGETVIAARLSGVQPAVVTVRRNLVTRDITPTWRMRDLRTGDEYAIKAIIESDDRGYLELTCERGVTP